jgi:hypothetical protein
MWPRYMQVHNLMGTHACQPEMYITYSTTCIYMPMIEILLIVSLIIVTCAIGWTMCPINERHNYERSRPEEPNITRFEPSICFRSIQGTKRTRCSVPDTQAPFPALFLCAATLAGRIRRGLAPMTSAPAPGPPTPWVDRRRAFDLQSPRQTLAPTLDSGYLTHDAARRRPGHDTLPAPGSTLPDRQWSSSLLWPAGSSKNYPTLRRGASEPSAWRQRRFTRRLLVGGDEHDDATATASARLGQPLLLLLAHLLQERIAALLMPLPFSFVWCAATWCPK